VVRDTVSRLAWTLADLLAGTRHPGMCGHLFMGMGAATADDQGHRPSSGKLAAIPEPDREGQSSVAVKTKPTHHQPGDRAGRRSPEGRSARVSGCRWVTWFHGGWSWLLVGGTRAGPAPLSAPLVESGSASPPGRRRRRKFANVREQARREGTGVLVRAGWPPVG
jgi:hypothetical protein